MFSIYWFADGAGTDDAVPRAMARWIRTQSPHRLIVYGGDVYKRGTEAQFAMFFDQMNRDVSDTCALPGNHDWKTASADPHPDKIPRGYDKFWRQFGPGESQQPVNTALRGGARYEHVKDIAGWRIVFLDTGPCNTEHWPVGDPGTTPDWKDDDNWCVTRIDLLTPTSAEVSILSFGADKPPRVTEPTVVKRFALNV